MKAKQAPSVSLVQPVECVADGHPRPVQQDAHIALGDIEQRADLGGLQLLLATQDQNRTLRRRQRFDHRFHMLQDAAALDMPFRRQVLPQRRHGLPVPTIVEGAVETRPPA